MSTEHKTSEEAIYYEALGKTPPEREAYVQAACGPDAALLDRVRTLLRAHEVQDNFLESPPWDPGAILDAPTVTETPGTVIGRYKLLEKIGEGGMAVVYMAEQTEPIRRKVALKIIKLGMDTRQVIARFEAERQALALMDHPNIAKVLDAGATETGRPYFVMELVTGVSITEYCDKNSLSTKDRLALFLQVCHAVQHAHQKGIIHRDIKPSNVMVTHHDGQPIPKVIDFGIAKATNQKLTEKTLFTRYAHIIGTPAYMSPEQAELTDLDIDTRTDIYSLGVLLYELLTGTTPFSEEDLRKAGYVEMQRVIREQEPVKPSTRIWTALRSTGVPPVKAGPRWPCDAMGKMPMLREVRGDLDWIVMKSLEKDRARRYETASGLAEDIRRHLEHEPVLARSPGAVYRLRKFLRRRRTAVLALLTMVVVTTGTALLFGLWSRGRSRLAEADELRHQALLSQARGQYAGGERDAALKTIEPLLQSPHVGSQAQLLRAAILVDNRHPDEATALLKGLLDERPEIAGAAHSLLARLLWESGALNAAKLKEIEDHRQQAEALLPKTAEAYFLRAMTAPTIKEQLAALDQALELDPKHYEGRRLRAFTYYASRKYGPMSEEAFAMQALRDHDPLSHSLRAAALRELGRYREALAEYDRALALPGQEDNQYLDLAIQRGETLLRMGSFDRLLLDAQDALKRWPDRSIFQYYRFAALTALGEYNQAAVVFQGIVQSTPAARDALWSWAAKYVFDTLAAGRSWHPPDGAPTGAAFLPLAEAEETYRELSAQGHRVTTDGFSAQWSPDGKKLAFSIGVTGNSGVALYDPATKETELLIVPGKYPRWSPDGRYIAFVRDRQFLRVPEFVAADPKNQPLAVKDQEVWLMKSNGTEPRRLARGVWPSWSRDSTCVYYRSPLDSTLYSIIIGGENVEPKRIMSCPGSNPSVSPDNRCVAYMQGTSLKVIDLASQNLVAEWPLPVPSEGWGASAWSPASNELCLGGSGGLENRTGLWIYRLSQSEPTATLGGPITVGSWSSDRTKVVFELGAPHFEIWTADLDRNTATVATLGPARTVDQHLRELVAFQTRRIETDPRDAYPYFSRARCYDGLHERANASADMKRWSDVARGRPPADFWLAMPRDLRYVLDLPFDCELVFSAERPVNTILMMSIAFGQKGRSEMKLFEIPMVVTSLVGFYFLSGLDAPPVRADFTFGEPVNILHSDFPLLDMKGECPCCFSADGLEMYVDSTRAGGQGSRDVWVCKRASVEDGWGLPENLGPTVNSAAIDGGPFITGDGLELYFYSTRPGGYGSADIYVTRRATRSSPWGPPTNLGPKVNSAYIEGNLSVSSDGLELYFSSNRPGGYGGLADPGDLYVSTRATRDDPWGEPVNLGPAVNSPGDDDCSCPSPDGLLLFFSSSRPGGYGSYDLWVTRRASRSAPWQPAANLGPKINGPLMDGRPFLAPDGSALYFPRADASGSTLISSCKAPIIPTVDFNGDGKVDASDLDLLMANWGKSNSVCDIGPYSWGDGVVDEKDLNVLLKAMTGTEFVRTPSAHAGTIPCNVSLTWTAVPVAAGYDVYLGTSFADVNTASRTDPKGVLVSKGQTASAYQPQSPLSYGQTYYWRVDFVGAGPAPTIYKGCVLDFTTAAYPIQNVSATASSAQANMGPEKTIDGSGLDQNDGHSTNPADMWLNAGALPSWIQYQFDKVYSVRELWVWNSNQNIESLMGFGARTVKIEYSTDGSKWTQLANVPEFARASGQPGYVHNTTVSFGGIRAQYVKLTIEKNWGAAPATGLSEVRFFYIPVQAEAPQPANNATGVKVDARLDWQSGREAHSHKVYFGTDRDTVAKGTATAQTVTAHTFDPGALNFGTKYYWRVDEVNAVTYPGDVWSFTTQEFARVDDFESYTDEEGSRIYETWIDGYANKLSGSTVGHPEAPFAERTIMHGGKQSMPLAYDNTKTPFYSEAERTFAPVQNWTVHGADTLTLWFRGNPPDFLARADGSMQMSGSGTDIWNNSDQFRFAYQKLTGDGFIVAKVISLTNTDPWAKAGVMIRGSLDPAAPHAFMTPTPSGRRSFQNRTTVGGNAVGAYSNPGVITFPLWVKVERKGANYTGSWSQDGKNWTICQPDSTDIASNSINPVRMAMAGDVYLGLAVTSHNATLTTIAEFSDVSFTGTVTGQWQVAAIGAEQPGNSAAPLYVAVEDSAGHAKSVTHPDPAAVLAIDWQKWMIPLSSFQGVNSAAVQKLTIGVGDRNKPTAGGTGTIYLDDIGFGHPPSAE